MCIEEKKSSMPGSHAVVGVLPLKVLCQQVIMVKKSKEETFVSSNHLWMLQIIVDTIPG